MPMALRDAEAGAAAVVPFVPLRELAVQVHCAKLEALAKLVVFLQADHRLAAGVVALRHTAVPPAIGRCARRRARGPKAPGGPFPIHTVGAGMRIARLHLRFVRGLAQCATGSGGHLDGPGAALQSAAAGAGAAAPFVPGRPHAVAHRAWLQLAILHLLQGSEAAFASVLCRLVDVAASNRDAHTAVLGARAPLAPRRQVTAGVVVAGVQVAAANLLQVFMCNRDAFGVAVHVPDALLLPAPAGHGAGAPRAPLRDVAPLDVVPVVAAGCLRHRRVAGRAVALCIDGDLALSGHLNGPWDLAAHPLAPPSQDAVRIVLARLLVARLRSPQGAHARGTAIVRLL
mmetsp:Transcript_134631/g.319124  ORF Transcript_134631/g.319124 Transcript_134631/m.319124 type:complete len:343 (+) Transcript_134631:4795-5823(+)